MSSPISGNTRHTQNVVLRYPSIQRRRAERRHSDPHQDALGIEAQEQKVDRRGPSTRIRSRSANERLVLTTERCERNIRRRAQINDLQADVEARLGWAGVHGIRGWSGLGAAAGTVCSVAVMILTVPFHIVPGMGIVAFVGAYLLATAIGVLVQYLARRNSLDAVQAHREILIDLREELENASEPDDFDSRQQGEEDAQLDTIERLLNDINGGFWYGMRCALAGFLDPTVMFREGWRNVFSRPPKLERRRANRRRAYAAEYNKRYRAPTTQKMQTPSLWTRLRSRFL